MKAGSSGATEGSVGASRVLAAAPASPTPGPNSAPGLSRSATFPLLHARTGCISTARHDLRFGPGEANQQSQLFGVAANYWVSELSSGKRPTIVASRRKVRETSCRWSMRRGNGVGWRRGLRTRIAYSRPGGVAINSPAPLRSEEAYRERFPIGRPSRSPDHPSGSTSMIATLSCAAPANAPIAPVRPGPAISSLIEPIS